MEIRLGESIRSLRKQAGLTQEQLAEALGVSVSAVHKWESGKATPELEMLVDIAEFFETSVDALLNYGWEKLSMGTAVEKLVQFSVDRKLDEGMKYAEKVLQKYPNSFDIVFRSANIYAQTMEPQYATRGVSLYQHALSLIEQNTDPHISTLTIQNQIAMCYCYMGCDKKAVSLLKENNVDGANDCRIGLLLSKDKSKPEEALKHLSEALVRCYNELYNLCIGYTNAYSVLGKPDEAANFALWLYELGKGLRNTSAVTLMDRCDVTLCMILADIEAIRGNGQLAYDWLAKAKESAMRFDASPEYNASVGLKFYHGSDKAISYDDMGKSAMSIIENHLNDKNIAQRLQCVWEKVCTER